MNHPKNKTKYKSLNKLAADPRVKEIFSEESDDNGIWVDLVPGFNFDGCSSVHEWSCRDVIAAMDNVTEGETY